MRFALPFFVLHSQSQLALADRAANAHNMQNANAHHMQNANANASASANAVHKVTKGSPPIPQLT